ncbi:MAG: phosphoribosylanthranilate isomerase [Candidatus Eisenbacteria sp.]|nr:phosphoribosylanthranilate isomerase [Candidatus Eisenbacteria bacterium]
MSFTRIKICGITTPEDALACESLGVEHVGVIFAESSRRVTPERAREIREAIPRTCLVGVFADCDPDEVVEIAEFAGLNMIQLHGGESSEYCNNIFARTLRLIIKSLTDGDAKTPGILDEYRTTSFFLFDLDKRNPDRLGAVRDLWKQAARATGEGHRVFLAGGLNPSNVREAIRSVSPFCVDVCSAVESSAGVKNMDEIAHFVREVRR